MRSSAMQSRLFQDGADFEVEVLGRSTIRFHGYMCFEAAMQEVRKHQPARKASAISAIEREFEKRGEKISFYTAVGSALDYYHGIDGFFVFRGMVLTVDVTLNPEKTVAKADIILGEEIRDPARAVVAIVTKYLNKTERRAR